MTKFIPAQTRVSGVFPVTVNGATTFLEVGGSFNDTASLLSALDGAGIIYTDPPLNSSNGVLTGRIRIAGTGSGVFINLNGVSGYVPVNQWFTPFAGHLEIIQSAGIPIELEYTTSPANPNLFVNGSFDDGATGWTASPFVTFTGGQAVIWDQDGDAAGDKAHAVLSQQPAGGISPGAIYDITVDIASITRGTLWFTLGGDGVDGTAVLGRTTAGIWTFSAQANSISQVCGLACSTFGHATINSITMVAH